MHCERIQIPGGSAIVCGTRRRVRCSACGELTSSARACAIWKIGASRTCDARLCATCAASPAPEKDLCPRHAAAWRNHPANNEK